MSALSRALQASAPRPSWYQALARVLDGHPLDPTTLQAVAYAATASHDKDRAKIARLEAELTAVEVRAHHAEHRIG